MRKGFTLIEAMIYLAILSISLAGIVGTALVLSNLKVKAAAQSETKYVAGFVSDYVGRAVASSGGIDWQATILDNDVGRLSLLPATNTNPGAAIYLDGQTLKLDDGAVDNLSAASVKISRFKISRLSSSTIALDFSAQSSAPTEAGPYYSAQSNFSQTFHTRIFP